MNKISVEASNSLVPVNTTEFGRDWRKLCKAFKKGMGGNTSEFSTLISSSDSSSCNLVCRDIGLFVFSQILTANVGTDLARWGSFFSTIKDPSAIGVIKSGGYIDKDMLTTLILQQIRGLVPESVSAVIYSGMAEVMKARTETKVGEEKLKQIYQQCQAEIMLAQKDTIVHCHTCERELVTAQTKSEIEMMSLKVRYQKDLVARQKKLNELDISLRELTVANEELKLKIAHNLYKSEKDRLEAEKKMRELEIEKKRLENEALRHQQEMHKS